jgi:DNA-binding NarL/FixJ family response regulator
MAIKLLVADDHEVVRVGLEDLLQDSGIEIVAQASGGNEAVQLVKTYQPDVILMDIRMTEGDGLEALEKLREAHPDVKVVILSTYDNPTYIARSVALGAADYVLKGASRGALVEAIKSAAAGSGPSADSVLHKVAAEMNQRRKTADVDSPTTHRETQVLRHIALGLSNREIGNSLGISVETVKEHVQNILRKIACTDRTQAAVWAVKNGLVT